MKILSKAILFAGRNYAPFLVSRQLSNCLVPWYITNVSEGGSGVLVDDLEQFVNISPFTSQFIRSFSLLLFTMDDLDKLLEFSFMEFVFPTVRSVGIHLVGDDVQESFDGESIALFVRKFSNLDECALSFSYTNEFDESVDWQEVCSLFSNLFSPPYLQSAVIVSLMLSLRFVPKNLTRMVAKEYSAFDHAFSFVESLVDYNIMSKIQQLMLLLFRSTNDRVTDVKCLPIVFDLLVHTMTLKQYLSTKGNNVLHSRNPSSVLRSFLSIEEMTPTLDLIDTLLTNGDLGPLLHSVTPMLQSCSFIPIIPDYNNTLPQGLIFMQRYGRRMLPSLLKLAIEKFNSTSKSTEWLRNFNSFCNSEVLFRITLNVVNDEYWYDGPLETVEHIRKMIDVDRRKVLSHFPFAEILDLLKSGFDGFYASVMFKALEKAHDYVKNNRLLIASNECCCPDFTDEKHNLQTEVVNKLFSELEADKPRIKANAYTHSVISNLWKCLALLVAHSADSKNKFAFVRNVDTSFVENLRLDSLLEKFVDFVDREVQLLVKRVSSKSSMVSISSYEECFASMKTVFRNLENSELLDDSTRRMLQELSVQRDSAEAKLTKEKDNLEKLIKEKKGPSRREREGD